MVLQLISPASYSATLHAFTQHSSHLCMGTCLHFFWIYRFLYAHTFIALVKFFLYSKTQLKLFLQKFIPSLQLDLSKTSSWNSSIWLTTLFGNMYSLKTKDNSYSHLKFNNLAQNSCYIMNEKLLNNNWKRSKWNQISQWIIKNKK